MSVSPRKSGKYSPKAIILSSLSSKSPEEVVTRGKNIEEEDEAAAFAGLSRLEQIRLRARRKVEKEERLKEEEESKPASIQQINDDQETDDDDELPDLNSNVKRKPSSQLTDTPPLSLTSDNTPHGTNSNGLSSSQTISIEDPSSSYSGSRSKNNPSEATPRHRSRRTTARLEPYIFRPSMDPVSDRRRRLMLAKESAAVQAKLMKREDFKKSASDGKSDAIEKVLREHRRDQKKGLDFDGLHATIDLVKEIKRLLDEEESEETGNQDGTESDFDSDEDTSSDSSSQSISQGAQKVRFDEDHTEKEKERERQKLAALIGDDEDNTEGQEAINILLKDREDAQKKKRLGEDSDEGLQERMFWREGKVSVQRIEFPELISKSAALSMLKEASASDQGDLLALVLQNGFLAKHLNHEGVEDLDTIKITTWLFEVAILTPTSNLSFAALQVIQGVKSDQRMKVAKAIIDHLPIVLQKMGAKVVFLEECFSGKKVLSSSASGQANPRSEYLRPGERCRAVRRLLQVLYFVAKTVNQKMSRETSEDRLHLFIAVLHMSIDPQHIELEVQFESLLEVLLEALLEGGPGMERKLVSRMVSPLLETVSPTTQRAILSMMPSTNLRNRALQQSLALQLFISLTADDDSTSTYNTLANMLSSRSAAINPLLPTRSRSYKQIEAMIQILSYTFNDLALQLISRKEKEASLAAKSSLSKVIQNLLDYDTKGFLQDKGFERGFKDGNKWRVSTVQIEALHRIMESMQILSNQIQEGKGAFLDRSKVKDQLQRLRLILFYELTSFGLAGNYTSSSLQQGTLSRWFIK